MIAGLIYRQRGKPHSLLIEAKTMPLAAYKCYKSITKIEIQNVLVAKDSYTIMTIFYDMDSFKYHTGA